MNAAESKIREWRERPNVYVREVLRVEPDDWQDEVLEAAPHNSRIALKASKGPGKSTVLAWLGWWFLTVFLHPKVVATSITGDNLRDGLWTELAKWQLNSQLLRTAFTWSAERIVSNDHPETWWAAARQWSKSAKPEQQADTLAGVHADNVLFLVDEAGGIPDAVVAAAEAGLANADRTANRRALLAIAGNPTNLDGPLYRACTVERGMWWIKEISGDPDDPKRAKRVSVQWAREQIAKYGRDNPWVLVNVFGKFPPVQSNKLLGVEDCAAAAKRTLSLADYRDEVKILGVDVARFGDDRTVIQPRQGRVAMLPQVMRNLNTMEVAGQVARVITAWRPDATFIDVVGIGAGVVDRLQELQFDVMGVSSGDRPLNADQNDVRRVVDRRAEMWCAVAEWIRSGGCIPNDPELISELCAPTYAFESDGRLRLESKKDLKKRGMPSPDKADALALTFAAPVAPRELREYLRAGGAGGLQATHEYDPYARRS